MHSRKPMTARARRIAAAAVLLSLSGIPTHAQHCSLGFALEATGPCGGGQSCAEWIDAWNEASWDDLVEPDVSNAPTPLAAVRWYAGEHAYELKTSPLCSITAPDQNAKRFCGVTDELSNVLLSHAMGSDQARYEALRNFTELLRHPDINGLQCWMYSVDGTSIYDHTNLCEQIDSASDASLRILGAYAIACAKQEAGIWLATTADYCADFKRQGDAIWGLTTPQHGEIKYLPAVDEYFLSGGFNNQVSAPTGHNSFWPDYLELQFLMDDARTRNLEAGVLDMLDHYHASLGTNGVHIGKRGRFIDETAGAYDCTEFCEGVCDESGEDCSGPYVDNIDTWRVIPALGGFLNAYPDLVPPDTQTLLTGWWNTFGGGNPLYGPTAAKPFEIYANAEDGLIRTLEESYRTLGMWIPLASALDPAYTRDAIAHLISKYDPSLRQFETAAYYGGYYSQFAQRAIGAATGMLVPDCWRGAIFRDGFESGSLSAWSATEP